MADVGIRNWKSFSNGYAASAIEVNGNFNELRSLLTATKLDDDNLQYSTAVFPMTVSVCIPTGSATFTDKLFFYLKLPAAIGPVEVISLSYLYNEGSVNSTCTCGYSGLNGSAFADDQGFTNRTLIGPLSASSAAQLQYDVSATYSPIPAGSVITFTFEASGGLGADQHSATLWLKTKHVG
jgi:hypothetical protein